MFVRPKLCLWAQAEPNAFFTSCEFKVFRLIHKVSVPKSAPPSLLLWAHGHTHAREARTDARCAPEEGVFAVGEAFGARSRRRGREKQGEFSTKRPYFCAKVPNFFKQVGHFFIPPPHPSRKALRRETGKEILLHRFPLKSREVERRKREIRKENHETRLSFCSFPERDCSFSPPHKEINGQKNARIQNIVYLWAIILVVTPPSVRRGEHNA